MKRAPIQALNFMNGICCLLVILIHVLSLGISKADPSSWQALLLYVPWRLVSFVVPAFLFTGAVKLALGGKKDSYGHYILARIKAIYLPYLLWTAIYYLSYLPVGYARGSWDEFFHYILTGTVTSPFYYIIIVMQFYLLRPLWLWLLDVIPWFVAVLAAIPLTLFFSQSGVLLQLFSIQFDYLDRISPSYLLFWVLGLYVGKYYDAVQSYFQRHPAVTFSLLPLILGGTLLSYVQYRFAVYPFPLDYFKLFIDVMDIAILLSLCIWMEHRLPALQPPLLWIHRASFSVYLSHCFFLFHGTLRAEAAGITKLSQLLLVRGLICYTLPFAFYFLWSKISPRLRIK